MDINHRYKKYRRNVTLPIVICMIVLTSSTFVQLVHCAEEDGIVYVPYGSTYQFQLCTEKNWRLCT